MPRPSPFHSAALMLLGLLLPCVLHAQAPVLLRGPYLQMAAPTAVTVCWRTDTAETGRVRFGTDAAALTGMPGPNRAQSQ